MANFKPNRPDLTENVNFRMTPTMRSGLGRIASRDDRSEAWVIRKAIATYLLSEHIDTELEEAA